MGVMVKAVVQGLMTQRKEDYCLVGFFFILTCAGVWMGLRVCLDLGVLNQRVPALAKEQGLFQVMTSRLKLDLAQEDLKPGNIC